MRLSLSNKNLPKPSNKKKTTKIEFPDNGLFSLLCGEYDSHILDLEKKLKVSITVRGNVVVLSGNEKNVSFATNVLKETYTELGKGDIVDSGEIRFTMKTKIDKNNLNDSSVAKNIATYSDFKIKTEKKIITPRSEAQSLYLKLMKENDLVFSLGPAGTGKTYLAVAYAAYLYSRGEIEKIILSRPAVEAGENLGYLPGDLKEKVDPYLRPLYDALYDMFPKEKVLKLIENESIEIAPIAFMRGRTLSNSFVILDEAQNTKTLQMKMFLTRMGQNSRMVVTGDLSQIDLPNNEPSGLKDAIALLDGIEGISMISFSDIDIVRHPVVTRIVNAYEKYNKRKN